jgi:hypothetical protein
MTEASYRGLTEPLSREAFHWPILWWNNRAAFHAPRREFRGNPKFI